MKAITVSNLRANLKTHLNEVSENSEIIIVPRNNQEEDAIVIMSIGEYNSLNETSYLMSSEANHKRLIKGMSQADNNILKEVDLDSISK